jgi:hypothetical protein
MCCILPSRSFLQLGLCQTQLAQNTEHNCACGKFS